MSIAIEDRIKQLKKEVKVAEVKLQENVSNLSINELTENFLSNTISPKNNQVVSIDIMMYLLKKIISNKHEKQKSWTDDLVFIKNLIKMLS